MGQLPQEVLLNEDNTRISVPANWIGQQVEVSMAVPIIDSRGQAKFPGMKAFLKEVLPNALLLQTDGNDVIMPFSRIWHLSKTSEIVRPGLVGL